jgi:hypothetical protein
MTQPLTDKRERKRSDKPIQAWVGGRYEDCSVVLKIGDNYFGGFSGLTDTDGRSMVKLRNGLTEAKLMWGLAKVRDYIRRLHDRGYDAKAYRITASREVVVDVGIELQLAPKTNSGANE